LNIEQEIRCLDFAEDAKEAFLAKIRQQHLDGITAVFDFVGPDVGKFARRVTFGELGLEDHIVFGPEMLVKVRTEMEVYSDHVRFVTKYTLEADGEAIDFMFKGFNVVNPKGN
jgi:hypothetical protein